MLQRELTKNTVLPENYPIAVLHYAGFAASHNRKEWNVPVLILNRISFPKIISPPSLSCNTPLPEDYAAAPLTVTPCFISFNNQLLNPASS